MKKTVHCTLLIPTELKLLTKTIKRRNNFIVHIRSKMEVMESTYCATAVRQNSSSNYLKHLKSVAVKNKQFNLNITLRV